VLNYFSLYAKSIGISKGLFPGLAVGLAIAIRIFGGTGLGFIFPALNAIGAEQGSLDQKAGAIDDIFISNYLISKMFQASLPARSDLGTDLEIQDYIGMKRCDERTIDLVKCKRREFAMMGLDEVRKNKESSA